MPIQYKLSKIENPQFAIIKEDEIENLSVDFEVNFSISSPANSIRCSLKAVYKNGDDAVMQIVVNCYFTLTSESWHSLTNEDHNIVIPKGFLQHLASITLGAARGIQFAKTESSELNKYIIPLVNMTATIKEDMVVDDDPDE